MDKKLLDKLNGFNLSMQQKIQLIELIQEAGVGASNGGGDSTFRITFYKMPTDTDDSIDIDINGKYRITSMEEFDNPGKEIYDYCLQNLDKHTVLTIKNRPINGGEPIDCTYTIFGELYDYNRNIHYFAIASGNQTTNPVLEVVFTVANPYK